MNGLKIKSIIDFKDYEEGKEVNEVNILG